jgi:hypothetical protein
MIISFHIIIYCHPVLCCKGTECTDLLQILFFHYASELLQPRKTFLLSGTLHLHQILELTLILDILP